MKSELSHRFWTFGAGALIAALIATGGCGTTTTTTTTTVRNGRTETVRRTTIDGITTSTSTSDLSIDTALSTFTNVEHYNLPTGSSPVVVIGNDYGNVKVIAGPAGALSVIATRHAAREVDLARLGVAIDSTPRGVTVRLVRPKPKIDNLYADLAVKAPLGAIVRASTDTGNVAVSGFSGDVTVSSSNGNVRVSEVTGHTEAHSDSGTVSLLKILSANADSSNGNVTVDQARGALGIGCESGTVTVRDSSGQLSARDSNGDIAISDFSGLVAARSESGSVSVERGIGALKLASSNGNVTVNGGDHSAGPLEAKSESGAVRVDTRVSQFDASSSNGDVTVHTSIPLVGQSTVASESGSVEVTLSHASNVTVTASTVSGSITNGFGLPVVRREGGMGASMNGVIGVGGARLTVADSNGDIKLNSQ